MLALALVLAALQQPAASPLPPLPPLPPQVGDTSPFRRLALAAPNELREGSGRPGPRYWQQRADYSIRATLDTATHTIAGSETLRYTNNSPDTLRYLWLQLDPPTPPAPPPPPPPTPPPPRPPPPPPPPPPTPPPPP